MPVATGRQYDIDNDEYAFIYTDLLPPSLQTYDAILRLVKASQGAAATDQANMVFKQQVKVAKLARGPPVSIPPSPVSPFFFDGATVILFDRLVALTAYVRSKLSSAPSSVRTICSKYICKATLH